MYSINRGVYLTNWYCFLYLGGSLWGEGGRTLKSYASRLCDFYVTSYGTKHHNVSIKAQVLFILYLKINLVNNLIKCTVLI